MRWRGRPLAMFCHFWLDNALRVYVRAFHPLHIGTATHVHNVSDNIDGLKSASLNINFPLQNIFRASNSLFFVQSFSKIADMSSL